MTDSADRLESWKEIAAYLRRDVRTVQRWEAAEGLPVHRHQHKKRGSVFALQSELDAWRSSRQHELFAEPEVAPDHAKRPARPSRVALAGAAALAAAAAVVFFLATGGRDTAQSADPDAWDAPRLLGEFTRDGAAIEHVALGAFIRTLHVSPDGRTLFAETCDDAGFRVHAVDIRRRTVRWTQEIGAGGVCGPMTMTPDGERLLVGDRSDIVIVDTNRPSTRRLRTPATVIRQIALAPNGRSAYVAAVFQGLLSVDLETGAVATISPFPCPVELARSPVAERLWVSYQCSGPGGRRGHDVIEEFDTATNTSAAVITALPNVGGELLTTPDGGQLWADGTNACRLPEYDQVGCPSPPGGVINVIRTHDRQLLRSISAGPTDFALRLSVTPDGQRVVAGRRRTSVLSTSSLTEVESSPLPLSSNVAFSPDGRVAFAAIGEVGSVAILPIGRHPAPPSGLSARWSFDGVGRDIIGSTDIVGLADAAFGPGRVGQAVRLPFAQGIRLHEIGNLQVDGGHFSAMGWVKLAADQAPVAEEMTLMEYVVEQAGAVAGWRIYIDGARRPVFCLGWFEGQTCHGPRTTVIRGQPLAQGEWHHVAATRSGPGMTLLVDGQTAAFGDAPDQLPSHSVLRQLWLRLGSDEAGRFPLVGWLDEVELYNRTLAPSEVLRRMQ